MTLALLSGACSSDVLKRLSTKTDEFVQNAAAKVDILWVVDNSESMRMEQEGLGASFEAFIGTDTDGDSEPDTGLLASGVDFHIGVICTDVSCDQPSCECRPGRLHAGAGMPAFIDNATVNPKDAFLANVQVGWDGGAQEKGLEAAALALGRGVDQWRPGDPEPVSVPDPGFLRRGFCLDDAGSSTGRSCEGTEQECDTDADCERAALFLIFVSDEDDSSFGPVRYFWRLFDSYYGPGNEPLIKLSAIVGYDESFPEDAGCFNPARGSAVRGDRYIELVQMAGGASAAVGASQGIYTSICEDFGDSLTALSINAAGLASRFELSSLPNLNARVPCDPLPDDALCVKVDGTPVPQNPDRRTGWTYQSGERAIFFGADVVPPPRATITVLYQGDNS